jgi:hypothetical protein
MLLSLKGQASHRRLDADAKTSNAHQGWTETINSLSRKSSQTIGYSCQAHPGAGLNPLMSCSIYLKCCQEAPNLSPIKPATQTYGG